MFQNPLSIISISLLFALGGSNLLYAKSSQGCFKENSDCQKHFKKIKACLNVPKTSASLVRAGCKKISTGFQDATKWDNILEALKTSRNTNLADITASSSGQKDQNAACVELNKNSSQEMKSAIANLKAAFEKINKGKKLIDKGIAKLSAQQAANPKEIKKYQEYSTAAENIKSQIKKEIREYSSLSKNFNSNQGKCEQNESSTSSLKKLYEKEKEFKKGKGGLIYAMGKQLHSLAKARNKSISGSSGANLLSDADIKLPPLPTLEWDEETEEAQASSDFTTSLAGRAGNKNMDKILSSSEESNPNTSGASTGFRHSSTPSGGTAIPPSTASSTPSATGSTQSSSVIDSKIEVGAILENEESNLFASIAWSGGGGGLGNGIAGSIDPSFKNFFNDQPKKNNRTYSSYTSDSSPDRHLAERKETKDETRDSLFDRIHLQISLLYEQGEVR